MSEDTELRREQLRRQLRDRGSKASPMAEKLIRAVLNEPDEAISHDECIATLPAYVDAEMEGERIAAKFPSIKAHLDVCEECAGQYTALLDTLMAEQAGEILVPAMMPAPDLSFLPGPITLAEFVKQRATEMLQALAQTPLPDLSTLAEIIFDQIDELGGKFVLQPGLAQHMALDSGELSEATIALAATYAATQRLVSSFTPEQIDALQAENRLQAQVEETAINAALAIHVESSMARRLAREFARRVCADPGELRALVKQYR